MKLSEDQLNNLRNSLKKPASKRILTPVEIAKLIQMGKDHDSLDLLASQVGLKDKTFLKRFLKLLELPVEIQGRIKWTQEPGSIAFTQAFKIATSKNKTQIIAELNKEENNSITRREIRNLLR